jgi:hypothetical protein
MLRKISAPKNACKISVEKPDGKKRLGRPRRRWEENIKTDPME